MPRPFYPSQVKFKMVNQLNLDKLESHNLSMPHQKVRSTDLTPSLDTTSSNLEWATKPQDGTLMNNNFKNLPAPSESALYRWDNLEGFNINTKNWKDVKGSLQFLQFKTQPKLCWPTFKTLFRSLGYGCTTTSANTFQHFMNSTAGQKALSLFFQTQLLISGLCETLHHEGHTKCACVYHSTLEFEIIDKNAVNQKLGGCGRSWPHWRYWVSQIKTLRGSKWSKHIKEGLLCALKDEMAPIE